MSYSRVNLLAVTFPSRAMSPNVIPRRYRRLTVVENHNSSKICVNTKTSEIMATLLLVGRGKFGILE